MFDPTKKNTKLSINWELNEFFIQVCCNSSAQDYYDIQPFHRQVEHPYWLNPTDWRSTGTILSDFFDQLTGVPRVSVPRPQPQKWKNEVT